MTERIYLTELGDMKGRRWTPLRKAELCERVRQGQLSPAQACARYGLGAQEFEEWRDLHARAGVNGLRTTKLQQYRGRLGPATTCRLRLSRGPFYGSAYGGSND